MTGIARMPRLMASGALGLILILGSAPVAVAGRSASRAIGDTKVFAVVPDPGQPAGIAVDGQSVLVSTMGLVTQPSTDPRLFVFDRSTGALQGSVTVPRMMEASAMAFDGVAVDARGRAYVVDMNGRILRVDPRTGDHEVYAEFPAAAAGLAAMPFDLAFDRAGVAYVTDQNLAAIWRVPAGGGSPEIWFQDARLASYLLGPSGIRLDPGGRHLYFTVAASAANGAQGLIYRLPVDDPSPARLEEVFRYPPRSNPFGLAFGATGKLYVVLYGSHQVSVLRPDGTEELRFPSAEENGRRDIPFDRPASAAFDGHGSLLVTNSASFSPPARMVVFDAFVNDTGAPLLRPAMPGERSGDGGTTADQHAPQHASAPVGAVSRPEPAPRPRPTLAQSPSPAAVSREPVMAEPTARRAGTGQTPALAALTTARSALTPSRHHGRDRVLAALAALAAAVVAWRALTITRARRHRACSDPTIPREMPT